MIYKISILNDDNQERVFYITADTVSQMQRRVLSTYGMTRDRITLLAEYDEIGTIDVKLKKSYEESKDYSSKTKEKVDLIYSKLTKRQGQPKIDYIEKYKFTEVPINQKSDLYPLVEKYKKVKVYWENGEKRGSKKLYAVVK